MRVTLRHPVAFFLCQAVRCILPRKFSPSLPRPSPLAPVFDDATQAAGLLLSLVFYVMILKLAEARAPYFLPAPFFFRRLLFVSRGLSVFFKGHLHSPPLPDGSTNPFGWLNFRRILHKASVLRVLVRCLPPLTGFPDLGACVYF